MWYILTMKTLNIYEIDYSVSPGGINQYEIYDEMNTYICAYDNLVDATRYCEGNGYDYLVKLLNHY